MRLAIYAHYFENENVALHVFHFLKEIHGLGFEICFVSNSPVSMESGTRLSAVCHKVIQRENVGLDFSMWKTGLMEYDLSTVEELLLANSSIVGPLKPLVTLWRNPSVNECDFWGLTDNDEISSHLQSYFLIFRNRVIQSDCFAQFWKSVLPYKNKDQIIRSYEVGLTIWLQQNGFKWKALYPQCEIFERYVANREKRSFLTKFLERLKGRGLPVILSGKNTTLYFPDFLIDSGMPFLKLSLLKSGNERIQPIFAYKLLQSSDLPKDALEELRASLKVQ